MDDVASPKFKMAYVSFLEHLVLRVFDVLPRNASPNSQVSVILVDKSTPLNIYIYDK